MIGEEMGWRKSWADKNLDPDGTKRSMTPVERSIWDDLLDLASVSPVTGCVCVARGVPYTVSQLASIFRVSEKDLLVSLGKFSDLGLINKDLEISKWFEYQSEYQRQRDYRSGLRVGVTGQGYKSGLQRRVTGNVTSLESESESDTDKVKDSLVGGSPTFESSSSKKRNEELKKQALEVLEFLNQKSGRIFRPVPSTLEPIVCRLKSGVTVADCRMVIANRCIEWENDEKMRKFIQVSTIFRASNFEQYLSIVRGNAEKIKRGIPI